MQTTTQTPPPPPTGQAASRYGSSSYKAFLAHMQAYGREMVEREQARVEDQLPGAYLRDLQQPASFEGKPVRLLKPCDVPPGNLRSLWLQRFEELQDAGRLSRLPFLIYDGQFRFVPRSRLSFGTGSTTDDDAQQPPLHPPPVPPSFPEVYELLTLSPRNSPEASPGVPIGTRIRILWPGHNLEYEGTVQETEGSLAKIAYEDGDMHCWHRLSDCQYQVLPLAESDPAGSDPATTAALPSNDVPAQPPQRKRRRSPLPPAAPRRLTVVLQGRPFAHSTAAGREVRPDGTVARPKGRSPRRGRWDPALGAWEIVADPTSTGLGPSPPPPAPSPPAPSWPAAATAMTPRKLASQPRWRVFGTGGRPATPWK